MSLQTSQLAALRAAILAETDSAFVALRSAGATGQMAEWFNVAGTFVVWRSLITEHEITSLASAEGTTWSWPAFIARSVGEQTGWARMFNGTYSVNPSLPQVRAGFVDIFSGANNNAPAQRAHCAAIAKRFATRGERIYATGTGTNAAPGLLTFEGMITDQDVIQAQAIGG